MSSPDVNQNQPPVVRVTTYGKAAPGEAVAHEDFKSLVKGSAVNRNAKIVLELDAFGRDREGVAVLKEMRARGVENDVEIHITNGKGISSELLGELRALRATITWEFKALLQHKVEVFKKHNGFTTNKQVAEELGISASTLTTHLNRDSAIMSRSLLAMCEHLGISREDRLACSDLRLLGLEPNERELLIDDVKAAIDLLMEGGKPYPGDVAVVNFIHGGPGASKTFPRHAIYPVVREIRGARGLEDPYEERLLEVSKLDKDLRKLLSPAQERVRRDQEVGLLFEQMALLELQRSSPLYATQVALTVSTSNSEITSTRDIVDVVLLPVSERSVFQKMICDLAVRAGRLTTVDSGEMRGTAERIGVGQGSSYKVHVEYLPHGREVPEVIFDGIMRDAPLFKEKLSRTAWRYRDTRDGQDVFVELETQATLLAENGISNEFNAVMQDEPSPPYNVRWDHGLAFRGVELKKAGSLQPSAIAEIVKQLKAQRDACFEARRERPDSIAGRISGVDVVLLQDNRPLQEAIEHLNNESPFFSVERLDSPKMESLTAHLRGGRFSLAEVEALGEFFTALNTQLSKTSPLQGFRRTYETFVESVIEERKFIRGGLMRVPSEPSLSLEAGHDAGPMHERPSDTRNKINAALSDLDDLVDTNVSVDKTHLDEILNRHFPHAEHGDDEIPASLLARIEREGALIPMRRVFHGSGFSPSLIDKVVGIIERHSRGGEDLRIDLETGEGLEAFVTQLKGKISRSRLEHERREQVRDALRGCAVRALDMDKPKTDRQFISYPDSFFPSACGPFKMLEVNTEETEGAQTLDSELIGEVILLTLALGGEAATQEKVFGKWSEEVRRAVAPYVERIRNSQVPGQELAAFQGNKLMHWVSRVESAQLTMFQIALELRTISSGGVQDLPDRLKDVKRLLRGFKEGFKEILTGAVAWNEEESLVGAEPERRPAFSSEALKELGRGMSAELLSAVDEHASIFEIPQADKPIDQANQNWESMRDYYNGAAVAVESVGQSPSGLFRVPTFHPGLQRFLARHAIELVDSRELKCVYREFDRILTMGVSLMEIGPDLVLDYMRVSLERIEKFPELGHDWYGEELSRISKLVGSTEIDNRTQAIVAYIDHTVTHEGHSHQVARTRVYKAFATLGLMDYDLFADNRSNEWSPKQREYIRALELGDYERAALTEQECAREMPRRIDRLSRASLRNPHVRLFNSQQEVRSMEVAGDAREEMSHGSVGRQFADVAVGVVKGLAVSAGELSKIVELRRERFENEMRGDEARQAHLKELLREWFTLTAKHWTTTSLSLPTMARLFDDQTFKGFQSYGKLSQLLSHIERLNMHTRGLYSCDVGYLARFCEYEGR